MNTAEQLELDEAYLHLNYWQRQLRLDQLDIEIVLMRPNEKKGRLADCKAAPPYNRQTIRIRHPDDRPASDTRDFNLELEVVLVHELLHTKEIPWRDHPKVSLAIDKDEWLKQLHEDSLDAVAEALVRARRGILR